MGSRSTSKVFPGFDRLFLWSTPGSSKAFRANLGVATRKEAFRLTRAEVHPPHSISAEWAMGRATPVEVIRTTFAVPIIIADSVEQLLRTQEFTGWRLYDVSVRGKEGQPIPGYKGFAVTGRCGNIDWAQGIEVPRIFPAGVFPVWKGLFFDPTSWDGSDVFMSAEPDDGHVFVVEEVKQAFERAKIRNVEFTPLDQFERSWKL
ncbi:MAG TPA: hypothetical protein VF815_43845 [Myxococcaceae bacterium]|jgi:hypothetical protein